MDEEQSEDGNLIDNITNAAEARERIQLIIEELQNEQPNLIDPKNDKIDKKMRILDQIFAQYCQLENATETGSQNVGKSVNVSHAQMDIEAFRIMASINHQRIRAVQSATWSFRAADFASRIVKLVNPSDGTSTETMTPAGKKKLLAMTAPYINNCVPLCPVLGSITLEASETVPRERRRQAKPREERSAPVKQNALKPDDIAEEDQNTKVAKHVEYIMKCLKKEFENKNRQPVSYYHFVVDPRSFSNTVENIFYLSFLIKDGFVALEEDQGLPVLNVTARGLGQEMDVTQSQQTSVSKKQLIISLDYQVWQNLVNELRLERAKIDPEAKKRHVQKRPRH